jgi:hypothetical protein
VVKNYFSYEIFATPVIFPVFDLELKSLLSSAVVNAVAGMNLSDAIYFRILL